MFSGIVSHPGCVETVARDSEHAVLTLRSILFAETDIKIGESICVSGVCLTVVTHDAIQNLATFDLATETLRCTSLGTLRSGARVNLERSLRLCDRIDGHLVQGHVDLTVAVQEILQQDNTYRLTFTLPAQLARFIAPKGAVCIDGVSLTVGEVTTDTFTVYIIPHTWAETSFSSYVLGSVVNIEVDCIARYVERMLSLRA